MIQCKNCVHFERDHKTKTGIYGLSRGTCRMLVKALNFFSSELFWKGSITVMESFGCIMGEQKETNKEPDNEAY